jgi:hypothetical protein
MRHRRFDILGCIVAALLSGCNGTQWQGALPLSLANSWMSREAAGSELLYVADAKDNAVDVYSYPSMRLVGTLTGFDGLASLCVDKSGDIFIPDYGLSEILEYHHAGTKPVKTLVDGRERPYSCAFDTKTGDLAVANFTGYNNGFGGVVIYHNASGQPSTPYGDVAHPYSCAYDPSGDLFVEGYGTASGGGTFTLQELPLGSTVFKTISLDNIPAFLNGLQWDGHYLAVGTGTLAGPSSGDTYIYHVKISYLVGRTVGTTRLTEDAPTANFLIAGKTILVSGGNIDDSFKLFPYPSGGTATKTIEQTTPYGMALSLPK